MDVGLVHTFPWEEVSEVYSRVGPVVELKPKTLGFVSEIGSGGR